MGGGGGDGGDDLATNERKQLQILLSSFQTPNHMTLFTIGKKKNLIPSSPHHYTEHPQSRRFFF